MTALDTAASKAHGRSALERQPMRRRIVL